MPPDPAVFRKKLLIWADENLRDFPWRNTRDPYRVILAEILLHRTRADQVVPVYEELIRSYPDIRSVANSNPEEIEKKLYSLGLRWRARLFHKMACHIVKNYGGNIPVAREELESLPGVGPYIASAVRCFAFGIPEVIVDTNTVRIAGRVFGVKVSDSSRRNPRFRSMLESLFDRSEHRKFNYALLDLGALVCSKKPVCKVCPVIDQCNYGINNKKEML